MLLDTAVFKRLAHNDTGAAKGHQGGILIPKSIAQFFPPLTSPSNSPTVDARLNADLFVDGILVATVETRYQHQTWGGTRSPERRLTDNLGPLRNMAAQGDIVLFNKDLSDDSYIQIHLLRKGTLEFRSLDSQVGSQKWGPANPNEPPVTVAEILDAEKYLEQETAFPANAFGEARTLTEVVSIRKARNRAFRKKLLDQYGFRCAFTGRRFVSPESRTTVGLDAAHVVPVHANGSDHPANGLLLTKDLHWAFDRGLVGLSLDRKIFVPDSVASLNGNEFLRDLHGNPIREAIMPGLRIVDEAIQWHRDNVLLQ